MIKCFFGKGRNSSNGVARNVTEQPENIFIIQIFQLLNGLDISFKGQNIILFIISLMFINTIMEISHGGIDFLEHLKKLTNLHLTADFQMTMNLKFGIC